MHSFQISREKTAQINFIWIYLCNTHYNVFIYIYYFRNRMMITLASDRFRIHFLFLSHFHLNIFPDDRPITSETIELSVLLKQCLISKRYVVCVYVCIQYSIHIHMDLNTAIFSLSISIHLHKT